MIIRTIIYIVIYFNNNFRPKTWWNNPFSWLIDFAILSIKERVCFFLIDYTSLNPEGESNMNGSEMPKKRFVTQFSPNKRLQKLDSFDANVIPRNANLNSTKRKLDSFDANLNSTKRKLEFHKTQTWFFQCKFEFHKMHLHSKNQVYVLWNSSFFFLEFKFAFWGIKCIESIKFLCFVTLCLVGPPEDWKWVYWTYTILLNQNGYLSTLRLWQEWILQNMVRHLNLCI